MSSTNRGGQRTEADNYPTPVWVTHRFLDHKPAALPGGLWYEPCAGEGSIIHAVNTHVSKPEVQWMANELRPGAKTMLQKHVPASHIRIGDALDAPAIPGVSVVITNPPFRIAEQVLYRLLATYPLAYVVLLLRLNFWGSVRRAEFLTKYPADTWVLPNRPDFMGAGKTDSPEYAWFMWPPKPRARDFGRVGVLNPSPVEERRASLAPIIHI